MKYALIFGCILTAFTTFGWQADANAEELNVHRVNQYCNYSWCSQLAMRTRALSDAEDFLSQAPIQGSYVIVNYSNSVTGGAYQLVGFRVNWQRIAYIERYSPAGRAGLASVSGTRRDYIIQPVSDCGPVECF